MNPPGWRSREVRWVTTWLSAGVRTSWRAFQLQGLTLIEPSIGLAFDKTTSHFNWKNYYTEIEYQMAEAGGMREEVEGENLLGRSGMIA